MIIDGEEVRKTKTSENYLVSESGNVYSCFNGKIKKLSTSEWKQKIRKRN